MMLADDKIREAALTMIRAIHDTDNQVYQGKIINFTLTSEDEGDLGDWEITIQPTRYPAGKNRELTQ